MNHADGISRHRRTPYDGHTLDYKLWLHCTILSGFQSRCKWMWDLKLFNVVQLTHLSERLFQLSTIILMKVNFLISSLHCLLKNFLECLCLPPSSGTKNGIRTFRSPLFLLLGVKVPSGTFAPRNESSQELSLGGTNVHECSQELSSLIWSVHFLTMVRDAGAAVKVNQN